MTPDIREKAERLLADIRANDRQPLTLTSSVNLISQALLEAHNAGREEAARCVEAMEPMPARSEYDVGAAAALLEAATAIRSIT